MDIYRVCTSDSTCIAAFNTEKEALEFISKMTINIYVYEERTR